MVGDHPEHDIAGGRAAGLATLWVGEGRQWPGGEPPPDRTVADVRAAIGFLLDEAGEGERG